MLYEGFTIASHGVALVNQDGVVRTSRKTQPGAHERVSCLDESWQLSSWEGFLLLRGSFN